MAKAKHEVEKLVETVQDNDFGGQEPTELAPRGTEVEDTIESIRAKRAAARMAKGGHAKKRVITNYHDAERLKNLGLLTPEEHVDCEEAGLLPDPSQYATGSVLSSAVDGVE
jgi:hypothetical protein